jgi:glyoxylase-like metal-dependent hydrolase (beta-lactamase superfamily II)
MAADRAAHPVLAPTRGEGWSRVARSASQARAAELFAGLWSLRLPLPYNAPASVTCYLVALKEGWWLIDCGSDQPPGILALEHVLAQAGVDIREIRRLLCTHSHSDHAGLAGTVVARSGCQYLRGEGSDVAMDILRDPSIPLAQRRACGLTAGIPVAELDGWVDNLLLGDCVHPRPRADELLRGGECLDSALGEWTALMARGHASTQIVLHNASRQWLLSADLSFADVPPYLEWGWTDDPYGEHIDALARCAALPVSRLFPGHGRPDAAPAVRLNATLRRTERFAQDVLAALGAAHRTPYEIAVEVIDPASDTDSCQAGLSSVICVLEHFERTGALDIEFDANGVRRFTRRAQGADARS